MMTLPMLKTAVAICRKELEEFRLSAGLQTLAFISYNSSDSTLRAKAESLWGNYTSMLDFLAGGGHDERRGCVQNDISRKGMQLLNMLDRDIRISAGSDAYAKAHALLTKTYGHESGPLLEQWSTTYNPDERLLLQDHLFLLLWTMPEWSEADTTRWFEFIGRQNAQVQEHLLGAIFLSAWEYPDAEKASLLYETALSSEGDTRIVAATYSILLENKYKDYPFPTGSRTMDFHDRKLRGLVVELHEQIMSMHRSVWSLQNERKEIESIAQSDRQNKDGAFLEMKIRYFKDRYENKLDTSIGDCIVLLHSSPFMKEVPHWFLPFDTYHPLVQKLLIDSKGNLRNKAVGSLCKISGCDVDKYCLMELLGKNKDVDKIVSMVEVSDENFMQAAAISVPKMTSVIRNLYRFFAHSCVHDELESPFDTKETLLDNAALRDIFSDADVLKTAMYLHEFGNDDGALRITDAIMASKGADPATLYVAAGCEKAKGNYRKALYYYQQSDLLDENNPETLNNIQDCCERLGLWEERLSCLRRMRALLPDNTGIAKAQARTLKVMKKYREALELLYMLAYESEEDADLLYDLVTCAIAIGDFKAARKYTEKLKSASDTDTRMYGLLSGHIYFLEGDWANAVKSYRECDAALDGLTEEEVKVRTKDDYFLLEEMGVDYKDIRLIADMRARKE